VPVQLGIFSIAPRMAKGRHWDVYYYNKFDLPALMVEMVKEFGFDGYLYTETGGKLPKTGAHGKARSSGRTTNSLSHAPLLTRPTAVSGRNAHIRSMTSRPPPAA
jgi:hypothetical protein